MQVKIYALFINGKNQAALVRQKCPLGCPCQIEVPFRLPLLDRGALQGSFYCMTYTNHSILKCLVYQLINKTLHIRLKHEIEFNEFARYKGIQRVNIIIIQTQTKRVFYTKTIYRNGYYIPYVFVASLHTKQTMTHVMKENQISFV